MESQDLYDAFQSMGARILPSENEQAIINAARERNLHAQHAERDEHEAKFQTDYPDGFDRMSDEIEAMKQYGLYCGTCGHGNGCEHGVPASRH